MIPFLLRLLAVQCLHTSNVITVQFETISVRSVEWGHNGASHIGVSKTKGVTKLMCGCHQQISARVEIIRPILIIIISREMTYLPLKYQKFQLKHSP